MGFQIQNRRYTGSKFKLINNIKDLIINYCEGHSFLDVFAGTGVVSKEVSELFDTIYVNDFLFSNEVIYKAFFEQGDFDERRLSQIKETYDTIDENLLSENYFSINFGNKYFSENDAKKIGHIRNEIEKMKNKLTNKEYHILLASLIYSTDKIANTVGHYDAYFRNKKLQDRFVYKLVEVNKPQAKYKIYREDANKLVKKLIVDVAYIDPPYSSRQYSRFYHVLETLVKWDKPKLYGVAMKPEPENMSDYSKIVAKKVFEDLINNLKSKFIIVSYNNTYDSKSNSSKNKITYEGILSVLNKKGEVKIFEIPYRSFNAGKTDFKNHMEFLFFVKVIE